MFVGRQAELAALTRLREKGTASLFVCKGRRRIGKSRLVLEYSSQFLRFLEFQGLPPRQGQDNAAQLANFSAQLAQQTGLPRMGLTDWTQAFELLASQVRAEPTLILLDEISWLGRHDPDFAGKLKIAWDTLLARKDQLVVGICGSVSSWIEENILHNTHFVGRVTSTLALGELSLTECAQFWQRSPAPAAVAPFEQLKFLSVTGGVPRYLEELDPRLTAEENIDRLCFRPEGFLFTEMERIFDDSFDESRTVYKAIVDGLLRGHGSFSDVGTKLHLSLGGTLSRYLGHLEQSGFVRKDTMWRLDGKPAKTARYRLSDNYLRFYLRCIKPNQTKIAQGIGPVQLDGVPAWRSLLGLQFENLVYHNLGALIDALGIDPQHIISIGPYLQRASTKNSGGCQIDLLIHSKFDCLYLCELKFKRRIDRSVVQEVRDKLRVLKRPKYLSVRPVLLYAGELDDDVLAADFFFKCFDVSSLLSRASCAAGG